MDGYEKISHLGQGAFGKVKKVRRQTDQQIFACKVIRLGGKTSKADAEREYAVLRRLRHPYIVGYVDYQCRAMDVLTAGGGTSLLKVSLFMEYCPEGSLQDLIDRKQHAQDHVTEAVIWKIFGQLSSALRYCHYGICANGTQMGAWQPVLHRDIKPANVLVTKIETEEVMVKLGDFGLATFVNPEHAPSTYAGTPRYQAPEITRSRERGIRWTKSCDIFSLGCTVYAVCALSAPFTYRMEEDDICAELPGFYTKRLRNCVSRCQALYPEDRHDAFDLVRINEMVQETGNCEERKPDGLGGPRTPDQSSLLTPNADNPSTEASALTQNLENNADDAWESMLNSGVEHLNRREFQEADHIFYKVMVHFTEKYSQEHAQTAKSMYWFGRAQHALKKYTQAEQTFTSAVEIEERILGRDHENTADSIYWLGMTQHALKKYTQAEQTFMSAVEIEERILGRDNENTVNSTYWLGMTQHALKKYTQAEQTLMSVIEIQKRILGQDHENTADSINWLGRAQHALKKYTQAEQSFTSVIEIQKRILGQDHQNTANSVYWLGQAQYALKKYTQAEQTFTSAVEIRERILGRDHENTADSIYWLGRAQHTLKKYTQAEQTLTSAVEIEERILGRDHQNTAHSIQRLGRAQHALKKYTQAEQTYRKALSIQMKVLGVNHPDTISTQRSLKSISKIKKFLFR